MLTLAHVLIIYFNNILLEEADEWRLGLSFRELGGSHHRGEADEDQSFEGGN